MAGSVSAVPPGLRCIQGDAFPTLKRGASNHCAYGAGGEAAAGDWSAAGEGLLLVTGLLLATGRVGWRWTWFFGAAELSGRFSLLSRMWW